jgi:hypothetical protein
VLLCMLDPYAQRHCCIYHHVNADECDFMRPFSAAEHLGHVQTPSNQLTDLNNTGTVMEPPNASGPNHCPAACCNNARRVSRVYPRSNAPRGRSPEPRINTCRAEFPHRVGCGRERMRLPGSWCHRVGKAYSLPANIRVCSL